MFSCRFLLLLLFSASGPDNKYIEFLYTTFFFSITLNNKIKQEQEKEELILELG